MHTKLNNTHLFDTILTGFGFAFLLLFVLSTKASAATGCNILLDMQGQPTVISGGNIARTVTVKNTGKVSCKDTMLTMYYASNENFVSSTPTPRASNYFWNFGTLAPGKSVATSLITKHNASVDGATVDTEGCATASNGSDSCATSSVSVSGTQAPVTPVVVPVTPTTTPVVAPVPTPVITPTPTPAPSATPTVSPSTNGKEQGMWIWDFPSQMLSATADGKMKTLQANGFNAVYITTDDYLDIASMAEGSAKTAAKTSYFNNLAKFVTKAKALGMVVDAEGGWRDWAYSSNRYKGFALIDMVKEYNAAHPEAKLRGFQYDVEPYLLPEYEGDKATVLAQYVAFVDQSIQRLIGTDIQFSIVIPHFYDDVNQWTPTFAYNGKTTYAYNHLLNVLEKKPGSTILLMSYRNTYEGTNGTRAISETEVKEAGTTHTKVIVGQETGNVDPAYVTYYGLTKAALFAGAAQIKAGLGGNAGYGGTAVDYLDPFLALN
jgi:cell division septation protein DedD